MLESLKGSRTVIVNALLVAATAALQYLAGYDWVSAVGETYAVLIIAGINFGLRYITTSPIFQKK